MPFVAAARAACETGGKRFRFFRLRRWTGHWWTPGLSPECRICRRCTAASSLVRTPAPSNPDSRPTKTRPTGTRSRIALPPNDRRQCRSRASQPSLNRSAGRVGNAGCWQGAHCALPTVHKHLFKTRHGRRWADPGGRHSTTNAAAECGRGGAWYVASRRAVRKANLTVSEAGSGLVVVNWYHDRPPLSPSSIAEG